jgi:hypothetical protein
MDRERDEEGEEDGRSAIQRREELWELMCHHLVDDGLRSLRPVYKIRRSCVEYFGVPVGKFYVVLRRLWQKLLANNGLSKFSLYNRPSIG